MRMVLLGLIFFQQRDRNSFVAHGGSFEVVIKIIGNGLVIKSMPIFVRTENQQFRVLTNYYISSLAS